MSCFSNLKKSLLASLLFLFSVLSFSLIIFVSDSYADSVFDNVGSSYVSLCSSYDGSSDGKVCGYSFFKVESLNSSPVRFRCSFVNSSGSTSYFEFNSPSGSFAIFKPDITLKTSYSNLQCRASNLSQYLIKITLTDNLGSPLPSGNIDITENGTYDVTNYATATVNVENEVIYGDYHNDLININNSILICGAICLVLYFFYSIYRMIIKSTGSS